MRKIFERNIKLIRLAKPIGSLICLALLFTACYNKDYSKREFKANEQVIANYLKSDTVENTSEFAKILEKTGYMDLLATWGNFTVFVPTNDAVQQFLTENGKSSIDDFSNEFLLSLVKSHLLASAFASYDMGQGRLADSTLNGNYLTISYGGLGFGSTLIDKRARIVQRDIQCSNGIVHRIDKVLIPINDDIYSYLLKQPEYSMMVKAITETGYDSMLKVVYYRDENNQKRKNMFTLFLPSDSALKANGYTNFESIKQALSSKNPKDKKDALNQFVAFHLMPTPVFSDQFETKNYETLNANFMLNINLGNKGIVLNKDSITGRSVTFIPNKIDKSLKNGVIHHISKDLKLLIPPAVDLIIPLFSNEEIRNYFSSNFYSPTNAFEVKSSSTKYKILVSDTISNYKFKKFKWSLSFTGTDYQPTKTTAGKDGVKYAYEPGTNHASPYWTGSYGYIDNSNVFTLYFTVGPIVPTTYAVSIGYKMGTGRYAMKVLLDGEEVEQGYSIPKITKNLQTIIGDPDAARYTHHAGYDKWGVTKGNDFIEYYLGSATFTTQTTHAVTITNDYPGVDNSGSKTLIIDYIRFRPIK